MAPALRDLGQCLVCGKQRMVSLFGKCRECEQLVLVLEKENLLPDLKTNFINERLLRILLKATGKDAKR